MQQKNWKISEVRDGESVETATGASHEDAVRAIRAAMYGEADAFAGVRAESVHDLPLAA